jgi:UDP-N-acetylmuramoyl-L-alanyl-D-glutamate--2,6-diaminopimelate ligase
MMEHGVRLTELLCRLPFRADRAIPEVMVSGVVSDSRQVKSGSLFIAQVGGSTDGHLYIPSALERGAVAIVGTQPLQDLPVPYILVEDSRKTLPHLAAAFYDFPACKLTVIGVTGTDGKTTTTNLIYKILEAAGNKVGMISTVNAVVGDRVLDTGFHVTTPDATDVQYYLTQMVQAGLTHVVLESTSHGLAQFRVDACEFDVGVVTNITHEHLDYHGSYEAYRAAKGRLFSMLAETKEKQQGNPRLAVLNRDDDSYLYLSNLTTTRQVTYGLSPQSEVRAENIQYNLDSMRFEAIGPGFQMPVNCHLMGAYNVSNCLGAITATVVALGVRPESAQVGIAALEGVPGRMESVNLGQDFTAIVDFAHTPNALRRSLEAARQMTMGRVIAVFGSAGLRDRQKRRMMAETSAQLADLTILTAEDPRTESLDDILHEMAAGAEAKNGVEGKTFWRVPDRGEAIRLAVGLARPGDVVITCGKGHEQSMCFGETEYPWDDRIAMRAALSALFGVPGPEMPYLPTQGNNPGDK